MPSARAVDPSISKTPLPLDAEDLPTVCVLCSHNCGLRVDVAGGEIVAVRADETNPITQGLRLQQGLRASATTSSTRIASSTRCAGRPTARFEQIDWEQRDRRDRRAARTTSAPRIRRAPSAWSASAGRRNHMDAPYAIGVPARRSARGAGSMPSRRRRRSTT